MSSTKPKATSSACESERTSWAQFTETSSKRLLTSLHLMFFSIQCGIFIDLFRGVESVRTVKKKN